MDVPDLAVPAKDIPTSIHMGLGNRHVPTKAELGSKKTELDNTSAGCL